MLGNALLLAFLAAAPDVGALHRELDAVASRIEQLKGRRESGESVEAELQPLLVRSQELADELEQAGPRPAASPARSEPDGGLVAELRARAAELRDEADGRSVELVEVELRIVEARWGGSAAGAAASASEPRLSRAHVVTGPAPATDELAELLALGAELEAHIRALRVRASNLDAAADALERSSREE